MCSRCPALEEALKTAAESEALAIRQRDDCEMELRTKRARITRLIGELERERGQEVEGKVVQEIIEHWRGATGHFKAKVSQVGERAQYVRKALHFGYTIEELKRVCDVAGAYPFVDPKRSKHPSGRCQTGETLRDDIPTLFKSEKTIDRLLDLAETPSAPGANEEDFSTTERWRRLNYPSAVVIAAMWELGGFQSPEADAWTSDCPVHFGPGLKATRHPSGIVSIECERGCEFWRLLAALDLQPADLFQNAEHDPERRDADVSHEAPAHLKQAAGLLVSRLGTM